MPRYIDAEDFERRLEHPPYTIYNGEMFAEWYDECMKSQPTADVQEVKHGRWIESDFLGLYGIYYRCSVCNLKDEVPTNVGEPLYYYCPWCGAKMDLEDGEEDATNR